MVTVGYWLKTGELSNYRGYCTAFRYFVINIIRNLKTKIALYVVAFANIKSRMPQG